MVFAGMNYLAIVLAAVLGFVFGSVWYGLLGKAWMTALGKTKEEMRPTPAPFIIAFLAQLIMAFFLAGLVGHMGEVTIATGLISGLFVWLGFIAPTLTVNHRFQDASWSLTIIDAGHWLGVALVMGLVIGFMGL